MSHTFTFFPALFSDFCFSRVVRFRLQAPILLNTYWDKSYLILNRGNLDLKSLFQLTSAGSNTVCPVLKGIKVSCGEKFATYTFYTPQIYKNTSKFSLALPKKPPIFASHTLAASRTPALAVYL